MNIQDLKCCGNCAHRKSYPAGRNQVIELCDNDYRASWEVCKKWEYDEIIKGSRLEG